MFEKLGYALRCPANLLACWEPATAKWKAADKEMSFSSSSSDVYLFFCLSFLSPCLSMSTSLLDAVLIATLWIDDGLPSVQPVAFSVSLLSFPAPSLPPSLPPFLLYSFALFLRRETEPLPSLWPSVPILIFLGILYISSSRLFFCCWNWFTYVKNILEIVQLVNVRFIRVSGHWISAFESWNCNPIFGLMDCRTTNAIESRSWKAGRIKMPIGERYANFS